jgi:hypothetical protein
MASKDFEIQQLLEAYRKGLISEALFEAQMTELGAAHGDWMSPTCWRFEVMPQRCLGTEKGGQYALWLF